MTIKLRDFIEDSSTVFTKDMAKSVYYKATGLDDIEALFKWYSFTISVINQFNFTNYDWKDELFVEYTLNKIRGNKNNKFTILNELKSLELVKLLAEANTDGEF